MSEEPKQPCIEALRASRPDVAILVTRTLDESFSWDGDGPDPEDEGYYPHDVDVRAVCIRNGQLYEGTASLGGSYFRDGEPNGEIHGYLPQMVEEAVEELDRTLNDLKP